MALIVITDKPGQAGNQLWAYVNMLALAKGFKKKVILTLEDPVFDFLQMPEMKSVILITKHKAGYKLWKDFLRFIRLRYNKKGWALVFRMFGFHYQRGLLEESSLNKIIKKRGVLFLESWPNRVYKNLNVLNEEVFKNSFVFSDSVTKKIDEVFKRKRETYELIVGVHIRRGDYKEFKDGRYYYSDEVYVDKIWQIHALFPGKKVLVLLCSNEKVGNELFKQVSFFQIEDAVGAEDMYALSCCDYLIGPPSTFSMWASYYGSKPLQFIYDSNQQIHLSGFKRAIAQDVFE